MWVIYMFLESGVQGGDSWLESHFLDLMRGWGGWHYPSSLAEGAWENPWYLSLPEEPSSQHLIPSGTWSLVAMQQTDSKTDTREPWAAYLQVLSPSAT